MEKVFGATERHDQLLGFGTNRAVLIYGYGEENGQGYDYRHIFYHTPTKEEVRNVLIDHINSKTDEKILSGFVWRDMPVWLSMENQFNFKSAYDIAVQKNGATLPVTFKLGERDGHPVYYTFETMADADDFYISAVSFIQQTLQEGWVEKDNIDLTTFGYE